MKKSDKIKQSALDYAKKKGLKPIDENIRTGKVNPQFAAKVAQAYQDMHHAPNDPKVKASYDSLLQQTADQYKHLKEGGLKLSPIKPGQANPYAGGSKALLQDLHENNHMWYYPTEQGFGSEGQESKGNPLLKPMGENVKGHNLLANDMFRIVHDYFGHGMSANTFGAKGEENAYREHKQMFTPDAHGALTSETRGQNSWVNFGPHGQKNRANPQNTTYAPQKTGLMPDWTQKIYKSESKNMKKSQDGIPKSINWKAPSLDGIKNHLAMEDEHAAASVAHTGQVHTYSPDQISNIKRGYGQTPPKEWLINQDLVPEEFRDNHDYRYDHNHHEPSGLIDRIKTGQEVEMPIIGVYGDQHIALGGRHRIAYAHALGLPLNAIVLHNPPDPRTFKKSNKREIKHGDYVHLSHGEMDSEKGGYKVDRNKKYVARGKVKPGYQRSMWVVPHGEKDNSKGFYHRYDRMHHADDMEKSENNNERFLYHFSPQQGLKTISPKYKGSGADSGKRANQQIGNPISYYYLDEAHTEPFVTDKAKSKYRVALQPDHKIYDPREDAGAHIKAVKDKNNQAFNMDMMIDHLKEKGYHGIRVDIGGIPGVAAFHEMPIHSEESLDKFNKSEDALMKSKNVKEQKEKVFGRSSQPSAKSPQREKHMQHIRDYAQRRYGLEMKPSGGKVDVKTGERRSESPEVGVDKPDWRSGQLEAQANPDAMVHELGHLEIMPPGVGLEQGQTYMDKQYADVQREYGYMKQKQSQGEIQPMGLEQLLRRRMGLPANRSAVPAKSLDAPPRMAVDTNTLAGTRVPVGQTKQGQTKYADLIRQSRFVSPENKERVDKIDRGELVYDKRKGWIKPDISSQQGTRQNINSLINVRAREKAKDPTRKDAKTLMRSEKIGISDLKKAKPSKR